MPINKTEKTSDSEFNDIHEQGGQVEKAPAVEDHVSDICMSTRWCRSLSYETKYCLCDSFIL